MPAPSPSPSPPVWRAVLAGLCAYLVGLGLARFAYTPLLPAIVQAHWFDASQAAYLGAANLAGYLAGALSANPLASRWAARAVLRWTMLVTSLTLLACAWPLSFSWFFVWRFVSGFGGGVLMVLAAPAVLTCVAAARRGLAGGLVFLGVGLGVAASGTLIPLLLEHGLALTWTGLAALSLLLTGAAWSGWPQGEVARTATDDAESSSLPASWPLRALWLQYALVGLAVVPHMVFLVDYVARGLGEGVVSGSRFWVAFGIGAMAGPVAAGQLADRLGLKRALQMAYALLLVAMAIALLGLFGRTGLFVSSVLMSALTPGVVPLVLGRLHELLAGRPDLHRQAWSRATVAFATMQAAGAYGMSFLLTHSGGNYALLFGVGVAAVVLVVAMEVCSLQRRMRAR
ncbi:YbfB/YjiJ family MFS transporter [Burkholderiaceae bacterium UC74_6]